MVGSYAVSKSGQNKAGFIPLCYGATAAKKFKNKMWFNVLDCFLAELNELLESPLFAWQPLGD